MTIKETKKTNEISQAIINERILGTLAKLAAQVEYIEQHNGDKPAKTNPIKTKSKTAKDKAIDTKIYSCHIANIEDKGISSGGHKSLQATISYNGQTYLATMYNTERFKNADSYTNTFKAK